MHPVSDDKEDKLKKPFLQFCTFRSSDHRRMLLEQVEVELDRSGLFGLFKLRLESGS